MSKNRTQRPYCFLSTRKLDIRDSAPHVHWKLKSIYSSERVRSAISSWARAHFLIPSCNRISTHNHTKIPHRLVRHHCVSSVRAVSENRNDTQVYSIIETGYTQATPTFRDLKIGWKTKVTPLPSYSTLKTFPVPLSIYPRRYCIIECSVVDCFAGLKLDAWRPKRFRSGKRKMCFPKYLARDWNASRRPL